MSLPLDDHGSSPDQLRRDAWIGDAVLLLFARTHVLQDGGQLDDLRCTRLTSNQFLNVLANPTKVEAVIGRIYQKQGLEAAMQWMKENLLPLFQKQEQNRRKRLPARHGRD